jgi:cyclase
MKDEAFGEIYLNSIDRDGTGQGYDLGVLDLLPTKFAKPVILAGGVGSFRHFESGLDDERVNAVATAQLHNFIGDGMKVARKSLLSSGFSFPIW